MSIGIRPATVSFPESYDERAEWEHSCKGFLPGVIVELQDGRRYQLYFMDPVRLQQDAEEEFKLGYACFTEPALVVIPEVTRSAVLAAVARLQETGYFEHLQPQS
jgi:hypothetical protein